jgi:hypothetical protein
VLRYSLVLACSAGPGHVLAGPVPPPPDGAGGRLTQWGTGPVMMPPTPSESRPGPLLNARIIVSPAGMPPLPTLTVTERCPFPFTPVLTDTAGCGAGRGRGSDPIGGQPGRTGTTLTRAPIACRVTLAPATPDARSTDTVCVSEDLHGYRSRTDDRDLASLKNGPEVGICSAYRHVTL